MNSFGNHISNLGDRGNTLIQQIQQTAQKVRFVVRAIIGVFQSRNDQELITRLLQTQGKLSNQHLEKVANESIKEPNDIVALRDYLLPLYQKSTISHYDPLFSQALEEEINWFVYPIFEDCVKKYNDPKKIIAIFQNSIPTLNLLGRNTLFNQNKSEDNPLFLNNESIEATTELKEISIGKAGGCPLMKVKSKIKGTLMTDFILTCVSFWLYRKFSQPSK